MTEKPVNSEPPAEQPADRQPEEPLIGSYELGPFVLELATHRLLRGDTVVPIGVKAFDTLVALVKNHQRVITKEELIKWIWPDSFVSEDSLTHTISAVRRALGDDPTQPRFIATIARRGYRFVGPVKPIRPDSPAQASAAATPVVAPPSGAPAPVAVTRPSASRLAWVGAGAAAAALIILGIQALMTTSAARGAPRPLRFVQALPLGTTLASGGALSPDGNYLTFVARDDRSGRTQLWLRSLDSVEAAPLEGTDGATRPFWSPDSRYVAFFADSRLMRVSVSGGAPQSVTPTIGARPAGGTWGAAGAIVFADGGNLYSVPETGGTATMIREGRGGALRRPQMLTDGRTFLFDRASFEAEQAGTFLGSFDSTDETRLLDGTATSATYAGDGYLIFVRDRVLAAQRLDIAGRRLIGDAFPLAGNVAANAMVSGATNGVLAFGGGITAEGLVWFDRGGTRLGTLSGVVPLNNMSLSPDQRQLVGSSADPNQPGMWMVDLDRVVSTRLMVTGNSPMWSPDGLRLAFIRGAGARDVAMRSTSGGEEEPFWSSESTGKVLNDWSADGRYLVFVIPGAGTKNDIWYVATSEERKEVAFLRSTANEIQAEVSPNGRWIAYASDESGTWNVYVDSFPVGGAKRTVSTSGGAQPQWRADGRELFYLSLDNQVMAAPITDNGTLQVGRAQALFRAPVLGSLTDYRNLYATTRDGSRFLIKSVAQDGYQEPITLLVNWRTLTR